MATCPYLVGPAEGEDSSQAVVQGAQIAASWPVLEGPRIACCGGSCDGAGPGGWERDSGAPEAVTSEHVWGQGALEMQPPAQTPPTCQRAGRAANQCHAHQQQPAADLTGPQYHPCC